MATSEGGSVTGDSRGGLVVVLAPFGHDAPTICGALHTAGVAAEPVDSMDALVARVRDAAGATVITEEALTPAGVEQLAATLDGQASWSDLPVLLLLAGVDQFSSAGARAVARLTSAGNTTVLVRPVPSVALVTAVLSALRARKRQYEVRDLLERERVARVEAESANRLKDEFLATVSHELRTPVSAMLLWTGLLSSGRAGPGRLGQALDALQRSAASQSELIEDLLDMSRMAGGTVQLDMGEVDLAALARDAVAVVAPMADARNVRLTLSLAAVEGVVRGDRDRLQQVLWNLLGNAIKFTPAEGRVAVEVRCEASRALIRVTDTGQGIDETFLPFVFERFRQADAAPSRRHGGLGLGLAIAQQIVELHGGTMSAASEGVGKGATFTIELPLTAPRRSDAPPPPEAGRHVEPHRALAGMRVLLVEDDVVTRQALCLLIEDAGAEVVPADSAGAALAALETAGEQHGAFDIMLSDIGMPGEDGFALMRMVRERERAQGACCAARAVAISGYSGPAEKEHALCAGFDAHVTKPVDAVALIALLADLHGSAATGSAWVKVPEPAAGTPPTLGGRPT